MIKIKTYTNKNNEVKPIFSRRSSFYENSFGIVKIIKNADRSASVECYDKIDCHIEETTKLSLSQAKKIFKSYKKFLVKDQKHYEKIYPN